MTNPEYILTVTVLVFIMFILLVIMHPFPKEKEKTKKLTRHNVALIITGEHSKEDAKNLLIKYGEPVAKYAAFFHEYLYFNSNNEWSSVWYTLDKQELLNIWEFEEFLKKINE